ncbi:MAG: hypothetical protein ABIJ45_14265 [Candidatus Zixiibacteriota bacterium]
MKIILKGDIKSKLQQSVLIVFISLFAFSGANARLQFPLEDYEYNSSGKIQIGDQPYVTIGVHNIGKIGLTVSNQGHFGTGFIQGATNPFGGEAPSCTFPYPGGKSYLFAGSFWIGAVVGRDTLVSVGADGWRFTRELWPDKEPQGGIIYRSISGVEADLAISEQDFIATYTDTFTDPGLVQTDPFDGRPHIPLNIEVVQRSYAWSYAYAEDFVLFDYSIKNIGFDKLSKVYMGFYVDADVNDDPGSGQGHDDDICGYRRDIASPFASPNCNFRDTINIAYIADNDGIQSSQGNDDFSYRAVTGMRVVRTPSDSLQYSFNWWISNGAAAQDFGPRLAGTPEDPFRDFGGFLGTPEGDLNKYYIMRHQEFDYDQLYSAVDYSMDGWLPPSSQGDDFANGFDTRYLLSFGPFDIYPGEILPISFAYVAGEDFHTREEAFEELFDPEDPDDYYNYLNFNDLGLNSVWASWVYDNPGVDTDGDGYSGRYRICSFDSVMVVDTIFEPPVIAETTWVPMSADTLYYIGDGIPDFNGASPPPAPELWILDDNKDTVGTRIQGYVTSDYYGEIVVKWNGHLSETTKDVFSGLLDFEGYRVYISNIVSNESFQMLCTYDIEDYNKYYWNSGASEWQLNDPPFTKQELTDIYGLQDPALMDRDNPFYYSGENWVVDSTGDSTLTPFDSLFYIAPQDWNQYSLTDSSLIHKVYPDEPYPVTLNLEEAAAYYPEILTPDGLFKYFEYEYIIRNLLPSQIYYVSVTAFDYGAPNSGLASLETRPYNNFVAQYAIGSADMVEMQAELTGELNVIAYPNPYIGDGSYKDIGYEGHDFIDSSFGGSIIDQDGMIADRTRSIHFINLPHRCTIRIFTLDGDLVRQITHDYPKGSPRASHDRWDMITRNTQAVVSGIYYYSIESEYGNQLGKLVIIL